MPTPTTVVLFGATGDLAQRKLLPGLLHLFQSGLLNEVQVVGTSLDEHDRDSFVEFTRKAIAEYGGEDISYWSLSAAGAIGIMLPVVLFTIAVQRNLIRGLTFGAVKG